jgi:signal transduction histidine kinase
MFKEPGVSSNSSIPDMSSSSSWLHRWIYYLTVGFMFTAIALRSILVYQDSPLMSQVLLLLAVWLLIFIANALLARQPLWISAMLIGLEVILVLALLQSMQSDFFAFLLAITGMQAMQQFSPRVTVFLIGLSALLTFLALLQPYGAFQAVALTLVFTAVSIFLGAYIWSTRRARIVQEQQQVLLGELQEANHQLEYYSQQLRQLAASRERQRLARELHDSVTQTIFSMTLATQSALLLLERDRKQVADQLDRLDQLAQSTLSEMRALISKLIPENMTRGGFVAALQQHLADRHRLDNLFVTLDVVGSQLLGPAEEAGLFRIAQEALNNIVKHAKTSQAVLRLHLEDPLWMEIEDQGVGFDLQQARESGQMGLVSMRERAVEIGWILQVDSFPGAGTRIRVEKNPEGARET